MFDKPFKVKQLDIDFPEFKGLPEDTIKSKLKIAL